MVRQETVESDMSVDGEDLKDELERDKGDKANASFSIDWTQNASSNNHLFMMNTGGEEACYLGNDCQNSKGAKMRCSVCKICAHDGCHSRVQSQTPCRTTFISDVRNYRENGNVAHHWITTKKVKGKCRHCSKSFKSAGLMCSWCKICYHNSEVCKEALEKDDNCGLGIHSSLIVPPNWLVKLPKNGAVESSLNLDKEKKADNSEYKTKFVVKPIPVSNCQPLIVFLNPKSGGNQGVKLMQRFQALLNPRQVFDLTQGGPGPAIEMFKNVPGVRFLACGGDGTAGWVLSVLDKIKIEPTPPVGVLPLGTGNDLSRSLGWGGGYMDESISDWLVGIQSSEMIVMDRWRLSTTPNKSIAPTEPGHTVDLPPLDVVNNYFSMGVDALIALQFHEAREANPQKFNSRLKNKMYYGQAGGKDLIVAKWKKLTEFVTLECDGQDMTPKLKELKIHSILFLNIPCFGSGTRPWNRGHGPQKMDDGIIEVIGLTTYQLPLLQAGGHGHAITQCKTAKITTTKTIPVQVDGEAARLNPCTIELSLLNKAKMLAKKKGKGSGALDNEDEEITVEVGLVYMDEYEDAHMDREKIAEKARIVGKITADPGSNLGRVRAMITKLQDKIEGENFGKDWVFVDNITARNAFRINNESESSHFLIDICQHKLLILSPQKAGGSASTFTKTASPAPAEKKKAANIPRSPQKEATDFHLTVPSLREGCTILEKTSEGVLKAARLGDMEMLESLHKDGYSLLSIDETAKTALHYGARFGHKEIIRYLVQKAPQCIVDMTDNEKGQTALHKAAAYKRRDICCMLIAAGASLLVQDKEGRTPAQLVEKDDTELINYLESQQQFQEVAMQDVETVL